MIPMITTLGLAALALAPVPDPPASTLPPTLAPTPPPAAILQIRASEIYIGDGTRITDGVLVLEGGKIKRVGRGVEVDDRHPVIDHDGVITAGMVACQAQSGTEGEASDRARTILPEARIAHAFRPTHSDFEKALAAGITSLVLAPSADNLIGGVTAVVKSAGGTVVVGEGHLSISFGDTPLGAGSQPLQLFFGSADGRASLDASGDLENTESSSRGARYPTSYAGAIRELDDLFADPKATIERAAKGELPVLLEAWTRHEVARAAEFARRHELRGAIRGAPLAGDPHLLPLLQASGLGVILGPFDLAQARRSLESVRALQEAGISVAFALGGPGNNPEMLRISAARAVSVGADQKSVWKALTSDAARIAAVDDRVGLLAPGKDADIVLWSGNPLNLTSRVEAVYVDGRRVFEGASE
jgi:imidazolonepropionase-like amidohydrolase